MIAPLTLLLAAAVAAAPAASPSPAPQGPVIAPQGKATASAPVVEKPKERLAIVSCFIAYLWNWPDESSAPWRAPYPPARQSDAIHVIGTEHVTTGGYNLTETTIDIVEPWGYPSYNAHGRHYWIDTDCIV